MVGTALEDLGPAPENRLARLLLTTSSFLIDLSWMNHMTVSKRSPTAPPFMISARLFLWSDSEKFSRRWAESGSDEGQIDAVAKTLKEHEAESANVEDVLHA
jgi:hypothetical protein